MKRNAVIFAVSMALFCSTALSGWAQRRSLPDEEEEKYDAILSFGVTTNTNSGLIGGVVVRHSKALNDAFLGKDAFRYLSLELVNVKSPREINGSGIPLSGSTSMRNKLNYLFAIRPEYGRDITLFKRNPNEGITVGGILAVGPTLGLEKPYMIQYQENGRTVTQPYDPRSSPGNAVSAGFFSGLGKSKFVPGAHVKAALSFELSTFRNNVTGIEVGFLAEGYGRKINIAANGDNHSFFTSGFLTLYFGSKK